MDDIVVGFMFMEVVFGNKIKVKWGISGVMFYLMNLMLFMMKMD